MSNEKETFYSPSMEKTSDDYQKVYSYFRTRKIIKSGEPILYPTQKQNKNKDKNLKMLSDVQIKWEDLDQFKYILLEIKNGNQ